MTTLPPSEGPSPEARETVTVVSSGSINRTDLCSGCGKGMLWRVDKNDRPRSKFCGEVSCLLWLMEVPVAG